MATSDSYIDWTDCELVERIPGKVSGRPMVRGTRILAGRIVQDAELGSPLEEIHENYPDCHLPTFSGSLQQHATASYMGWISAMTDPFPGVCGLAIRWRHVD